MLTMSTRTEGSQSQAHPLLSLLDRNIANETKTRYINSISLHYNNNVNKEDREKNEKAGPPNSKAIAV